MSVLDKSRPMLIYISQRWAEVDEVAEKKSENCRINKLETTDDTLTSRGGLTFFVKYVGSVGVLGLLLEKFTGIKKSAKGVSVGNLFHRRIPSLSIHRRNRAAQSSQISLSTVRRLSCSSCSLMTLIMRAAWSS